MERDTIDRTVDLEARSLMWVNNPEPERNDGDPQVVQESVSGKTWLWHSMKPEGWLIYEGETAEVTA